MLACGEYDVDNNKTITTANNKYLQIDINVTMMKENVVDETSMKLDWLYSPL